MKLIIDHNEDHLLDVFRQGCDEAFRVIYDQYYAKVFAMAKRYTGEITEAQDVTAEAFIKLWRERESVTGIKASAGRTW